MSLDLEKMVMSLRQLNISQICSNEWKEQRCTIEKIVYLSQKQIQELNGKVEMDPATILLLKHDKLSLLIHDLILMEHWRWHCLPSLFNEIAKNTTSSYIYISYENILLSLLQSMCYFEDVILELGEEACELMDYAWRNLSCILGDQSYFETTKLDYQDSIPNIQDVSVDEINSYLQNLKLKSDIEEEPEITLKKKLKFLHDQRVMASISLLWYIIERINQLPLGVMKSALNKHDLPVGIAQVILIQPWLRRVTNKSSKEYKTQKFKNGVFETISEEDILLVTSTEAHAWFIAHYLLCDREIRMQYNYTKNKKELIIPIKKFLTDPLIDQLPVLVDLQRAIEELHFLEPPIGTEEKFRSTLLIEQVPRILNVVTENGKFSIQKNWLDITNSLLNSIKSPVCQRSDALICAEMFEVLYS